MPIRSRGYRMEYGQGYEQFITEQTASICAWDDYYVFMGNNALYYHCYICS